MYTRSSPVGVPAAPHGDLFKTAVRGLSKCLFKWG